MRLDLLERGLGPLMISFIHLFFCCFLTSFLGPWRQNERDGQKPGESGGQFSPTEKLHLAYKIPSCVPSIRLRRTLWSSLSQRPRHLENASGNRTWLSCNATEMVTSVSHSTSSTRLPLKLPRLFLELNRLHCTDVYIFFKTVTKNLNFSFFLEKKKK